VAKVEIDEVELQNNVKLRDTVAALMKNPKSRRKMLEAQKEAFPDTPIPELDAAEPLNTAIAEVRKEFTDYKKSVEEERAKEREEKRLADLETNWEKGRADLRRDYKVTDDGLKAVEEFMQKNGIIKHDIGWAAFSQLHPPAAPATPSSGFGGWDFMSAGVDPGDKYLKELIESKGQSENALNGLIGVALDETRGTPPRR